jgi:hypothetical protein
MPHGWMDREEPQVGRAKMRVCIYLSILWAIGVLFFNGALSLANDGTLPLLRAMHWIVLAPGPILIGLAIYFRFKEPPRRL